MSEVQAALFGTEAEPKTQELPELPMGWAWARLNEVSRINPGLEIPPEQLPDDLEVSFVPMKAIEEESGRIYTGDVRPIRQVRKGYTAFVEGDILFAKITPCMENGKIAVARNLHNGIGFGTTELHVVRPESGIDAQYLFYFLVRQDYRTQAAHSMTGTAGQLRVPADFLRSSFLPLPPLNEQRRIVEKLEELLSDLDAGVATLRQALAKLKRYRQAVLKAAVEGELSREWREANKDRLEPASKLLERILAERRDRSSGSKKYRELEPPNTSELPELPEGWVWASVEQVGHVQLGRQRSPKNRSKDYPTPYIRAANITEKGLDLSDVLDMEFTPQELEVYRLLPGDIVLSEASGSPDQVGKPAIWGGEIENCCFQNTVIRLRPALISSQYLLAVFRSYYVTGVFARIAGGVGINHLSAGKFARIAIPIAPYEEQAYIVAEVDRRLSEADRLEATLQANLKRAERLRQAILKKAFSGELVPQDPNDEPASVLLERIRASRAQAPKKGKRKQ
ncbi:restriction endonuclease subunit S [Meiothermus cerbereus]|uniref:restriction endonuclease subunit S n=1 Tax=Meiothermus cerbereus TaxID=65552 RepID=UPI00068882EC|nr:restriction endonuclease subunit S [Meiothermus cerbereus]